MKLSNIQTYQLHKVFWQVTLEPRLIRLQKVIPPPDKAESLCLANTTALIKKVKITYQTLYHQPLRIGHNSMLVEIWAHQWASQIAKAIKAKLPFTLTQRFANFISNRSDRIDCGERQIDSNRIVWDVLAPFNIFFSWALPKIHR